MRRTLSVNLLAPFNSSNARKEDPVNTRKTLYFLGIALALLLVSSVPLWAGSLPGSQVGSDPFILYFDEFGNGLINQNGTGWVPESGTSGR